jgi:small subunit ribosomal protein S27Ae
MIMSENGAAPAPKEKEAKKKGKKERTGRKHESLKVWEYYEVREDSVLRKRKHCPRCGPGTSLSEHKDRQYCGRCGYTQFQKGGAQQEAESSEQKEEKTETAPEKKEEEQPKADESSPEEKSKEKPEEDEKPEQF